MKMKKLKIFSMFSGMGGAEFSLQKAGIDFECVGFSEIDKFAIQCYEQNHKGKNYGDCTKINPIDLPDFDLLTGGFSCQPFSVSGKGLGEQDTRGKLFYEIIRIAEVKKPKYMLLENVKGLTFKNHRNTFNKILSELKRIGYSVCWKVLNSKDYGIPQSRARVFFICFKEEAEALKFKFPEKEELKIFVKDILEKNIEEKSYLSEKHIKRLLLSSDLPKRFSVINPQIAITQTARQFANWKGNYVMTAIRGRYENKSIIQKLEARKDNCSNSLTTIQKDNILLIFKNNLLSLRKLTPKECFRLMGFLNDEINLDGLSDAQCYKIAGNGWDILLVSKIFKEMMR